MLVLGIETSCDETAASVVEDGRRVRSDVVASQILVHAPYGGVVPEVASRQHLATIIPTVAGAVKTAGITLGDLDGIAVTCGPGLVGALLVGVETAKSLGYALGKPVVGVNHLAGHLAAVFLEDPSLPESPPYPHLALLVSGGHTALIRVGGPGQTRLLGATRDDAAGEAFDKVGKMLGLGYPGGVQIDGLAATGDPRAVALPRALPGRDDLDFSFSGLKTAVSTILHGAPPPIEQQLGDFCASFQAAVVDVLVRKSRRALALQGLGALVVCGGVAANRGLRAGLAVAAGEDGFRLYIPPPKRCTDNASMIAAAGTPLLKMGTRAAWDLGVDPGLPL
ncbi:MAG TPA: tRNA (adenosine(37)-N6)-threonylcarbamoyltransferase complex transferase subunit TsaD [Polyangia bacterium]|jgi:N6-L-threonylcarbamoyladenine synthase|nr:tRNA (adenosine(37)-N6)-threonylcarbamoyltransferase complex transferase subunit TsaD [Polyangia bacterium]